MNLPEPSPIDLSRAVYAEGVEFIYATHFHITLNQFECVIGFGTTRPPEPGQDHLNITFTHRLHLPLASTNNMQAALANLLQVVAAHNAQAAQVKPETAIN